MPRMRLVGALIALLLIARMPAIASGWVAAPLMTKGGFTVKMDGTTFAEGATRILAIGTFATFGCDGTDVDTYSDPLPTNEDGVHAHLGVRGGLGDQSCQHDCEPMQRLRAHSVSAIIPMQMDVFRVEEYRHLGC